MAQNNKDRPESSLYVHLIMSLVNMCYRITMPRIIIVAATRVADYYRLF